MIILREPFNRVSDKYLLINLLLENSDASGYICDKLAMGWIIIEDTETVFIVTHLLLYVLKMFIRRC